MLKYLQGNSRPSMSMDFHQLARFYTKTNLLHEQAIRRLKRYLLHPKTDDIVYNLDITKG